MTDTSTKTASSMFIPPEGAMQFVTTEFPDHFMWVGQPEPRHPLAHNAAEGCTCSITWPVINGLDLEPSTKLRGAWHVCACRGRIIE